MRYLISVLILSIVAFVQAWDIEIVDPNGSYHLYTSIALDSNGYPHICYDSDDFKYTHWTGSTWESETIDTAN
ncbi:MAG: hypothetical protein JXK93_11145, partial [Sphaerochaetaceae bacterium]|nr:hypothetical protein [Sphaerochaetaceae bacterium]